jgi:hypothetical protein
MILMRAEIKRLGSWEGIKLGGYEAGKLGGWEADARGRRTLRQAQGEQMTEDRKKE